MIARRRGQKRLGQQKIRTLAAGVLATVMLSFAAAACGGTSSPEPRPTFEIYTPTPAPTQSPGQAPTARPTSTISPTFTPLPMEGEAKPITERENTTTTVRVVTPIPTAILIGRDGQRMTPPPPPTAPPPREVPFEGSPEPDPEGQTAPTPKPFDPDDLKIERENEEAENPEQENPEEGTETPEQENPEGTPAPNSTPAPISDRDLAARDCHIRANDGDIYVTNEITVILNLDATEQDLSDLLQRYHGEVIEHIEGMIGADVRFPCPWEKTTGQWIEEESLVTYAVPMREDTEEHEHPHE